MSESPLLEVDDLHVHFSTRAGVVHAVNGLSFAIAPGETLALVGESGSGKSVTALAILGLIPPPGRVVGGAIRYLGRDLREVGREARRQLRGREIAYVPQEPLSALNPLLSIERQMVEMMHAHLPLDGDEARRRATELLARVGIPRPEERLRAYPHELSGGMRQRVMIAMALSCEPRLLIADEPTTALDVTIQAQIVELVQQLRREQGLAVLWITHDMGVTARLADRLLVLYAGRAAEAGDTRPLYRDPRHPYTIGLLRSIPRLDRPRREALEAIEGRPPTLLAPPIGCAFAPRCDYVIARCHTETPPLAPVGDAQRAACWVAPHGGRDG